jgi:LPS export ABC transporter protein LptC
MNNLSRAILAAVAVFVLLLAGTLFARSRTAVEELPHPAPTRADLSIKEVDLEEEGKGVRWRLRADLAQIFEREGRTTLRNLAVTLEEPDRTWTVVGDEGELLSQSKNVEIRRNVVVTSSDGLRLDTSVLRWDAAQQRLWTDAPVTLSRGASVVRGSGLEVKIDDEATTVSGRVRATFDLSGRR